MHIEVFAHRVGQSRSDRNMEGCGRKSKQVGRTKGPSSNFSSLPTTTVALAHAVPAIRQTARHSVRMRLAKRASRGARASLPFAADSEKREPFPGDAQGTPRASTEAQTTFNQRRAPNGREAVRRVPSSLNHLTQCCASHLVAHSPRRQTTDSMATTTKTPKGWRGCSKAPTSLAQEADMIGDTSAGPDPPHLHRRSRRCKHKPR